MSEIRSLVEQARTMGYTAVCFSGGEPFLKPGFAEILEASAGMSVTIFTSASLPRAAWMDWIVEYPQIKRLRVSLDGLRTHDLVRSGSDSAMVLANISVLKSLRPISIEVNTMLSNTCLGELPMLFERLLEVQPERWNLDIPLFTGRAAVQDNRSVLDLDFQAVASVLPTIVRSYLARGQPFRFSIRGVYDSSVSIDVLGGLGGVADLRGTLYTPDMHPCVYERVTVVRPNGDITRCPSHSDILANIREHATLGSALRAAESHPFQAYRVGDFEPCSGCRYLPFCGAGCRAHAYCLTGSDRNADPTACTLATLGEEHVWALLPPQQKHVYLGLLRPEGTSPRALGHLFDPLP